MLREHFYSFPEFCQLAPDSINMYKTRAAIMALAGTFHQPHALSYKDSVVLGDLLLIGPETELSFLRVAKTIEAFQDLTYALLPL